MYSPKARAPLGVKGRDGFIPKSETINVSIYLPDDTLTKPSPGRAVFGTSRRENEERRYISSLHSAGLPPTDTPGPGTYRTQMADRYPHSPKKSPSPTFKFGTAPQRPDEFKLDAASVPGPIYDVTPDRSPQAFSFAPLNDPERGAARSRADTSRVFLSAAHAAADRSTLVQEDDMRGVGPGQYDQVDCAVLSPKRRAPDIRFATSSRDAKNSLHALQMPQEPLAGTPAHTPGPVYDVMHALAATSRALSPERAPKFGTGPRSFTPQPGGGGAGPYISRLHELAQLGTLSPGPGSYSVVATSPRSKAVGGWIGDAPNPTFGSGPQLSPSRGTLGPGPGAYNPTSQPLSRATTAPAFTLGPAIRTDFAAMSDPDVPGPGAYNVAAAARNEGHKHTAPSYSLGVVGFGGRSSFVQPTCTPGPVYALAGCIDTSPRKGYSFGMKERTVAPNSTVSVRYHGPLAAQEGLGTQSPGPGLYDVRASAERQSGVRRTADISFGCGPRATSRIYISKLHSEADGAGVDSPGPGAYEAGGVELAEVTSRYRRPPGTAFGTSPRFNAKLLTF